MDRPTLNIYDTQAAKYARDWLAQPVADEIYRMVQTHFHANGATADIGCGSGRDVAWLNENGYPCIGYDASEGLLSAARAQFPQLIFRRAFLPDLLEIDTGQFQNVLCETVLMHLPRRSHEVSLKNLLRILRPGGILSLSWRLPVSPETSREADGRLYEPVDKDLLLGIAQSVGAKCLDTKSVTSASSGKKIEQLVLAKNK